MTARETWLSVVIAAQTDGVVAQRCLHAWMRQAREDVEILVVGPAAETLVQLVDHRPLPRACPAPPGALVPELWSIGIQEARGELVALSIDACAPGSHWVSRCRALTSASGDSGLGGPILPAPGAAGRDLAAYLVRYSSSLTQGDGPCLEIAGDNAVYRRWALEQYWRERSGGFWETLFHRELRAHGETLSFDSKLRSTFEECDDAWSFARLRFRHGRHFGSTRQLGTARRILASLAGPLIALTLLLRIRRRLVEARPDLLPKSRRALPWVLFFLSAWVLGECSGYALPRESSAKTR